MKVNKCFDCINHDPEDHDNVKDEPGWYHGCKLKIPNEGLKSIIDCKSYEPNKGFQIGGYYSQVHFELGSKEPNPCMEMFIHSDGEFVTHDESEMMQFHLCDFRQLEDWVKFWGDHFRKKGVIID